MSLAFLHHVWHLQCFTHFRVFTNVHVRHRLTASVVGRNWRYPAQGMYVRSKGRIFSCIRFLQLLTKIFFSEAILLCSNTCKVNLQSTVSPDWRNEYEICIKMKAQSYSNFNYFQF